MFDSSTSVRVHLPHQPEKLDQQSVGSLSEKLKLHLQSKAHLQSELKMESKSELPPPTSSPQFGSSPAHFTQNFPHFGQSIHFLPPPQQNQFSPIQFDDGRMSARIIKDKNSGDPPSEILDLDSNRVHLYNIQQEQNFYRPYFMAQGSPAIPLTGNGWSPQPPPDAHYASSPFSQEIYPRNPAPPPPSNLGYNNYVAEAAYAPPPPQVTESVPSLTFQALTQPPQARPIAQLQPRQISQVSPAPPVHANAVKKEIRPGETPITPEMMRGKGKGGACKRPKAYECTTCNKWFTSSGHLKRHYGTTLHKNSAQQNGTEGMEPAIGPGRGKGKKNKKIKLDTDNGSSDAGPLNSPRPLSASSDLDRPKNGINGITNELPPQPSLPFAPPVTIQHQGPPAAYLYIGDSQLPQLLASQQHQPQFLPNFDPTGTIYSNPHSIQLPGIYNAVGYPVMEVSLPPFNSHPPVSAAQYIAGIAAYQHQNGSNGTTGNGISTNGNSPEPTVKKEEPEESPEVGRGASPGTTANPWLSPAQHNHTSPEDSQSSQSSGQEPTESFAGLASTLLEDASVEA